MKKFFKIIGIVFLVFLSYKVALNIYGSYLLKKHPMLGSMFGNNKNEKYKIVISNKTYLVPLLAIGQMKVLNKTKTKIDFTRTLAVLDHEMMIPRHFFARPYDLTKKHKEEDWSGGAAFHFCYPIIDPKFSCRQKGKRSFDNRYIFFNAGGGGRTSLSTSQKMKSWLRAKEALELDEGKEDRWFKQVKSDIAGYIKLENYYIKKYNKRGKDGVYRPFQRKKYSYQYYWFENNNTGKNVVRHITCFGELKYASCRVNISLPIGINIVFSFPGREIHVGRYKKLENHIIGLIKSWIVSTKKNIRKKTIKFVKRSDFEDTSK